MVRFLKGVLNILLRGKYRTASSIVLRKGRRVFIDKDVRINEGTIIDDGVVIDGNVVIGRNCRVERDVLLKGNIVIGDEVVIGRYSQIKTMSTGRVDIGDNVLINIFSSIGAAGQVSIRDHCIFAAFLQITDASHRFDRKNVLIKDSPWEIDPVIIEPNVWLGSNVTVLKGVSIGSGAVIGAKSLVNKDIPSDVIAFGIPARVRKKIVFHE
ncbi:MAG: hypothetical protein D3904_00255 [Candidatus Electrothrix sp. EH2]|nr:hypothetical protein [Candidatus Electrothrix sp. EH2]